MLFFTFNLVCCRYESCHEYSSKVSAEDMLQFVDAVLFTDESLDKVES